jgi:hypothetical protein
MKKVKSKIKKGYVSIEIRSSMYDKNESLFLERMISKEQFGRLLIYICNFSEPKLKQ